MFEIELLICIKMDKALNNLQRLICLKNKQANTHTHSHTHVYVYICVCVCMCACVCVCATGDVLNSNEIIYFSFLYYIMNT